MVSMIVAAAGQGKRMGAGMNKLFLPLDGQPILSRTIERLQQAGEINEIIIVYAPEDESILRQKLLIQERFSKVVAMVEGGEERQDSICRGLVAVSPSSRYVGVHDGARPLVSLTEISQVIRAARDYQAALLAVPVKETIKDVVDSHVTATLDRSRLWAAQTPQVFERSLLEKAYAEAARVQFRATDDASLVERLGVPVAVVQGSYENIKITTPEDLRIAELLWRGAR